MQIPNSIKLVWNGRKLKLIYMDIERIFLPFSDACLNVLIMLCRAECQINDILINKLCCKDGTRDIQD